MNCPNCGVDLGIDIEKAKRGLSNLDQMRSTIIWAFNLLEALIRESLYKRRRWPFGEIIANLPLTETISLQARAGKKRFFLEQDILFDLSVLNERHWVSYEVPEQYVHLIYGSLSSLADLLDKAVPEAGIKACFQNFQQLAT